MFIDLKTGERIPKDIVVNNGNHEISSDELISLLVDAKKYEVLGIINRCEDDDFALKLLNKLPLEDKSFRMLRNVVKDNVYRNKFCEDKKFCADDRKTGNLTKEECIKEICIILREKLADLRASGEIELYKRATKLNSL
jgi:hypothetical protein